MKMESKKRAIDKIYKRRDRYEIPDWQREEVWDKSKKQNLIDSILRGWKLPKFYFLKTNENPDQFEVVDGQQRLNAIFDFFEDTFNLQSNAKDKYGGIKYSELKEKHSDRFDDYEIEYDEIVDAGDEEIKEFFQRLQEGMRLTASEKLNSEHSDLRDYCVKLAKHTFLKRKVFLADKRYAFFDITSKVATLEIEGIRASLRYKDVKEVFKTNSSYSENSASAKRLKKTFNFLNKIFPRQSKILKNRTIVQSIITFVASVIDCNAIDKYQKKFEDFFNKFITDLAKEAEKGTNAIDKDFIVFQQTLRGNIKNAPHTRHTILMRKFISFCPEFANEIDPTHKIKLTIDESVKDTAKETFNLVTSLNEHYNSKTGYDLFKLSTKTVKALNSFTKALTNYEDYKNLISDLYFVFWEGPSSKIQISKPDSFKDVNDLRTDLQHDVDHGKKTKVTKKRKKAGEVFKKYSGHTNPNSLEPELFPIFQLNILQKINYDLNRLLKSG